MLAGGWGKKKELRSKVELAKDSKRVDGLRERADSISLNAFEPVWMPVDNPRAKRKIISFDKV